MKLKFDFKAIGIIHTDFNAKDQVPIQSQAAKSIQAEIEIFPEYMEGFKDIDGFSYIHLYYYFDRVKSAKLLVKPYMDIMERGIFATRAPARPNPIGTSLVKLLKVDKNRLIVQGIDILNNTPLLDVKPYVPDFDVITNDDSIRMGWLSNNIHKLDSTFDDGRFL